MATILVLGVLLFALGLAIRNIIKGKASCSGNCSSGCSHCSPKKMNLYEEYKQGECSK